MARIGLRSFRYGGLKEEDKFEDCSYEERKLLKGAIECRVSLDIAEAELYADDQLQEQESVVSKGTITMGVADDDDAIFAELLGQTAGNSGIYNYKATADKTIDDEKTYFVKNGNSYNEVEDPNVEDIASYYEREEVLDYTSKSSDTSKDVGFGHIVPKVVNHVKKYKVEWFPKVRFKPFIPDATTKGQSLEFTTPSVEGTIIPLQDGTWEKHATFLSEADASAYLDKLFKQK